jgi:hypothetical protein
MQIQSSAIALQSNNSAFSLYQKTERLQASIGGPAKSQMGLTIAHTEIKAQSFISSLNSFSEQSKGPSLRDQANQMAEQLRQSNNNSVNQSSDPSNTDPLAVLSLLDKLKLLMVIRLLSNLQKDPKLMKSLGLDEDSLNNAMAAPSGNNSSAVPNTAPVVEYSSQETLVQSETSQFSAQGQVHTADGQTININLNLTMDRQSLESSDTKIRLQAATKDPLVINFDGSAAELSDQKFSFDLSSNGQKDLISQLSGNRAFLAIDKNNDRIISNGSELFGATTGDGFQELAQYDQDKNGWIDENDAAFKDLKLWINAGTEQQKLVDLKSAHIGALYTGSAATRMHVQSKDDSQNNLGVIQSTGLFLNEDGTAGTIQHVDLAV